MVAVRHVKPKPPRMTKTEQLQKFLEHWLVGPEAQKNFAQAGAIPLDFPARTPTLGFTDPTAGLGNIARGSIVKAGLVGEGVINSSLSDFFGGKDIAKMLNSKTSSADFVKSLGNLGLMYAPLKTPKGTVKSMMKPFLTLMNQLNSG